MTMFDKMLENETYKKLFDELPDDERKIVMENMRKLVEQFEATIIKPLENKSGE